MEIFLEKMLKLSLNVMVSSMDTMAKTMHEIQKKSETPPETTETGGKDEGPIAAFGNVSRLAIVPFFEMSKIPMNVFSSVMETISHAKQDLQAQPEEEIETNIEGTSTEKYDIEIVPLSEQETAQETKATLTVEAEEASQTTRWQIGRSGRNDFPRGWTSSFDYHVGTDIDEINDPSMPHFITVKGGPKPKGATEKLNILFTLDRDYKNGELAFIYDRWGAEKDQVLVNGELLAPIGGAGRGKYKHVALSLNKLSAGNHVITITASGETEAGGHRVDYVKLSEIETATKSD